MSHDVIVVGAGITGASTAYHLRCRGVERVLLIERQTAAAGGTGKSAAIVRQHYSTQIGTRLTRDSIALLRRMPEELGRSGGFVQSGWYMLVPASLMASCRQNIAMQQALGVRTSLIDTFQAASEMPWLDPNGVAGVVHEPDGGYADPVHATEAYVDAFQRLGGTYRPRTPVRRLLGSKAKVTGVLVDEGPIAAGAVVNAAGPWAARLAASVELDLPLRAVREQDTVWQARSGCELPEQPVSDAVDAIYLRPLGERRYIVGRGFPKAYENVDPCNYKTAPDEEFVSDVLERLLRRFPAMHGAVRVDAYTALYDVTPDWYPFIGPREGTAGYYDANGGSGHGFKLGPSIGLELARWIATSEARDDFRQLGHDRLAAGRLLMGAYGGNRG